MYTPSYPDIADFLKGKGVEPCPGHPTVNYTLPAIDHDGKTIMDSFAIAEYLEQKYPDKPSLFPHNSKPFARVLLEYVKASFHLPTFPLILPKIVDNLDPRGAEYFKRTRTELYGPVSHDIQNDTKRTDEMWANAAKGIKALAAMLQDNPEGPFFLGKERSYVDIVFFSRLHFYKVVYSDMLRKVYEIEPSIETFYDACRDLAE